MGNNSNDGVEGMIETTSGDETPPTLRQCIRTGLEHDWEQCPDCLDEEAWTYLLEAACEVQTSDVVLEAMELRNKAERIRSTTQSRKTDSGPAA
jgi:hypothetical protein